MLPVCNELNSNGTSSESPVTTGRKVVMYNRQVENLSQINYFTVPNVIKNANLDLSLFTRYNTEIL